MIINANSLHIPLVNGCVQCVVTSPPYYGLRDYGTATWKGGVGNCDHNVSRFTRACSDKQLSNKGSGNMQAKNVCPKCGAVRIDNQIGLEDSPEAYVERMVEVFREIKRVLRQDGVVWCNLGDSYQSGGGSSRHLGYSDPKYKNGRNGLHIEPQAFKHDVLKPKDLIGIPWRVAFALQADGWYLRSDIIWAKNNPMPESVQDRPTRSHEYIFLLSKSRDYYYDYKAIQEDAKHTTKTNIKFGGNKGEFVDNNTYSGRTYTGNGKRNKRDVWTVNTAKSLLHTMLYSLKS